MPKKEHNWFRLLFSESWSEHSLLNGRKTLVRINPAIALQANIEQQPDTERCCQKIQQQLQQQFNSTRRSMPGPDLSHLRTILSQTMNDSRL